MDARSGLTLGRLGRAALPLLIVAVMLNLSIVAVAVQGVNVPGKNEMIDFPSVLFAAIGPVLGGCIGFLISYRKPNRASLVGFLLPAVVITGVFVFITIDDYRTHLDEGVLIASLLVTVAPALLMIAWLLRAKPRLTAPTPESAAHGAGPAAPGVPDVSVGAPSGPLPRQVVLDRSGRVADPGTAAPAGEDEEDPRRTGVWDVESTLPGRAAGDPAQPQPAQPQPSAPDPDTAPGGGAPPGGRSPWGRR